MLTKFQKVKAGDLITLTFGEFANNEAYLVINNSGSMISLYDHSYPDSYTITLSLYESVGDIVSPLCPRAAKAKKYYESEIKNR